MPNRNPSRPVVVVATGDSVTASHFQLNHYHVPKKCAVRQNTASDHRGIPGADMVNSYVGQYVNNINRDVVDYYNFARTGFTTPEIISATRTTQDACENDWARAYPPLQLAEAAVAKAKRDGRIAYHVTTGGINNTNWSQVAAGVGLCGMAKFLRLEAARAWRNLPLNPVIRYYDPQGRGSNESDLIKGGACQLVVQIIDPTQPNPREITHARLRFDVPVYDGATHLPQITRDVNAITTRMVAAGADKVVWMGYYDLTPAKVRIGTFAAQYIQNTNLPDEVKGLVPNLPNIERELIPNPDWKRQAQAWTADLNQAIRASILPNDPIVRFQPAPALTADQIQKTMIGGCPHPNIPGHGELAKSLDNAIRAGLR